MGEEGWTPVPMPTPCRGNIKVVDQGQADRIELEIQPDPFCKGDNAAHMQ